MSTKPMNRIFAFVTLLFAQSAFALEVFKSTTDGFWPEHSENLAITKEGDIWFNRSKVGMSGLDSEIRRVRQEQSLWAIVIQAESPLDESAQIVLDVVHKIEAMEGIRVYLVK